MTKEIEEERKIGRKLNALLCEVFRNLVAEIFSARFNSMALSGCIKF